MSDEKTLKLIFNGKEIETRIFLTLDNLISFFKNYFSIKKEPNKYLSLFYYDEDGDQITFQCEMDYKIFTEDDQTKKIIEGELLEREEENEDNSINHIKSDTNYDFIKGIKELESIINKELEDKSKEELIEKMKKDIEEMKKKHKEELILKFKVLKEELNNSKKIIEEQELIINNLQNKLNSANIQLNQIESLKSLISKKDKELNILKQQLRNVSDVNFNNANNSENIIINKNNFKCVNFISNDQRVNFAIPCSGDSIFAEIEEQLYKKYPEYRETNNTFISDGKQILRFKTINDNRVGTGFPVMLIKPQ